MKGGHHSHGKMAVELVYIYYDHKLTISISNQVGLTWLFRIKESTLVPMGHSKFNQDNYQDNYIWCTFSLNNDNIAICI